MARTSVRFSFLLTAALALFSPDCRNFMPALFSSQSPRNIPWESGSQFRSSGEEVASAFCGYPSQLSAVRSGRQIEASTEASVRFGNVRCVR